jgi:hypothetical protein
MQFLKMVSSLWHLNLSDLFAGRSLSKEVWEIRVMPASHQELRVWQNATDLVERVYGEIQAFPMRKFMD